MDNPRARPSLRRRDVLRRLYQQCMSLLSSPLSYPLASSSLVCARPPPAVLLAALLASRENKRDQTVHRSMILRSDP